MGLVSKRSFRSHGNYFSRFLYDRGSSSHLDGKDHSFKMGSNVGVILNLLPRHITARAWASHRCNICSVPMPCVLPVPKDYIDSLLIPGISRHMTFCTGTGCFGPSIA